MYHSLMINDKNTYDDFGLIPTSRPIINPPSPKYSCIEVPGINGVLDVSEALTGSICYNNRVGSIEFLVPKEKNWSRLYSELMEFVQGKFMRIILEDDPFFYYEGRLSINAWKSNKNNSVVVIDYDLSPFKYESKNVIDGYIVNKSNLNGSMYYYLEDAKTLEIIIECESMGNRGVKVVVDDVTYNCKLGVNILPNLISKKNKFIRIYGEGQIKVKYRRGRL